MLSKLSIAKILATLFATLKMYPHDVSPGRPYSRHDVFRQVGRFHGRTPIHSPGMSRTRHGSNTYHSPSPEHFDVMFYARRIRTTDQCAERVVNTSVQELFVDEKSKLWFDEGLDALGCVRVFKIKVVISPTHHDNLATFEFAGHLRVFSFDPTMGAKDHKRSPRISFFNLGISNYKGYTKLRGINCSMDTYRGIVEKLGHSSTVIDYLKMDIEGSEIPVLKDIMDNDLELLGNIRQIGLEIHPLGASEKLNKRVTDLWAIFHRLECLGWRLLTAEIYSICHQKQPKFRGSVRSTCYELVWIK
ncbi:unnamed protein product [Meganyctiphanes norvegica]|uniref:Methyltransferase domain-containing protein n=1 Tax=Meganyctiphanes norvegica TaxID=48144 RepID=A0AAV2RIZ9_MEGNR